MMPMAVSAEATDAHGGLAHCHSYLVDLEHQVNEGLAHCLDLNLWVGDGSMEG